MMTEPQDPSHRLTARTLGGIYNARDNAFAFVRFALAVVVMAGHAWEVGGYGADPLQSVAGIKLGAIAVHAFFVVGGFLVAGSLVSSPTIGNYLAKRALRILPGFWMCLLVTALILAPIAAKFTPTAEASSLRDVLAYVFRNSGVRILQPNIGTLFITHPASGVFNGSLWSLFPELLCYASLAICGAVGLLRPNGRFGLAIIALAAAALFAATPKILNLTAALAWQNKLWYVLQIGSLFACFTAGATLWLFRDRVPFGASIRWLSIAALAVVLATRTYSLVGLLVLPFAVLALAVMIPWRAFDRWGDFSYGIYLYHFPVQQILIAADLRAPSPLVFFLQTLIITLPLAWSSWHLVEKRALRMKFRLISQRSSP